ncbi:hypothetical protein BH11VER1_BH11VER1_04290 [soil metagenome]
MRRSPAFNLALLIVVFFATGWIFMSLIKERFSSGEIYPPYSSLRTDPLGAKAIYEALDNAGTWECERNYKDIEKLVGGGDRTLMLLHVPASFFSGATGSDARFISGYAAAGGRVVITIDGQSNTWDRIMDQAELRREENRIRKIEKKKQSEKKEDPKTSKKDQAKKDKAEGDEEEQKPFDEFLGIFIKPRDFVMTPKGSYPLKPTGELPLVVADLPEWYSKTALVFEKPKEPVSDEVSKADESAKKAEIKKPPAVKPGRPAVKDQWKVLATLNQDVMIAERRFGQGSIVVVTDSYFASNEALLKEPAPVFLSWLVGNRRHVIFDETHLGTEESPGIMTLALRYHLQGFFFAGLVLFALYVWQSSTSLVPPDDNLERASNHVSGHGTTAGLISLLRRGISLTQVLRKGFETFEKGNSGTSVAMQKKIELAREFLPSPDKKRLPAGAAAEIYQHISDTLHPKRK